MDVFILLKNNTMDSLFFNRPFFSKTSLEKLVLELWENFIPYTRRRFRRNEGIGCPTRLRPSSTPLCVGVVWPHSSIPSPIPGRPPGGKRGLQGLLGYLVSNAEKMQAVWESEVLSEEEKRPRNLKWCQKESGPTRHLESWVMNLKIFIFSLSAFVLCCQFIPSGCPVVVYRECSRASADLGKPYLKLES